MDTNFFTSRGFYYDPYEGLIKKKGKTIGSHNKEGYLRTCIEQKTYLIHRMAFILQGVDPLGKEVDHINGIKDDNRWENLRLATTQQNQWNQQCHRNGKLPGVDLHKQGWRARLQGKHLGYFKTQQEAHECFVAAKSRKTEEST